MILGYSNRQLVTMAAILNKKFSSAGIFWGLFTMVLSGHPSNFPDNFSFLHFFPGWHDFWVNAPGLTVKHTVMDTVSRTGQTLLQTVCLPRLCLYSSLPVWQRVWSCTYNLNHQQRRTDRKSSLPCSCSSEAKGLPSRSLVLQIQRINLFRQILCSPPPVN